MRPNADRVAHIAPRFPGIVRDVRKRVGDEVQAGDVLAIVESESLSSYEVRAAFAGTVIARHIAPGEAARREEAAFIVADLSNVWVEINVYQQALPQVAGADAGRIERLNRPEHGFGFFRGVQRHGIAPGLFGRPQHHLVDPAEQFLQRAGEPPVLIDVADELFREQ